MDYSIAIFSHATKKQNENKDEMRKAWNGTIFSFIKGLGNRWGISPNSDYFPPEHPVHKARINEIKDFIVSTQGVYTTEAFESARQEQEKIKREKEEKEKRVIEQYEEKLRKEGKEIADEFYLDKIAKMKEEFEQKENHFMAETIKTMKQTYDDAFKKIELKVGGLQSEIKNFKSPSCFALDTKIQLASGKLVEMSELQVGDLVLSNVSNNRLEFSEVYLISHMGHHDYSVNMVKIEFTNPDGSKGQILMTPMHCIFDSDLSILFAQDLVPGKTEILVFDKANELIPVIVDSLIIEKDTGYISFYTRAGTVIANNTFCSCYDDCPPSQFLMDLTFAPIRLWTKVFPSTHRQKELHPYVQILETAYAIWGKALEGIKMIGRKK
ncbi:hypothetical protein Glove_714g9 [Diversispora epigaea]|uniref:Hedgehog protein Hint domain-containing protein n=1 Tax=Diversispora epigaea TaxID=1348612 RepID=A0A397G4Z7_9GLOM|nr:hypothetical protein Glove_714g9 [Diversispora epigaea]